MPRKQRPRQPRIDLPGEEWRPIPGWEGRYEVSDHGRVYSIRQHGRPKTGRMLKTRVKESGHLALELCRDAKGKQFFVHYLVALAFIGPRPDGLEVRHLDGDPTNNTPGNLRYGTRQENVEDRERHRTWPTACGKGHPYSENLIVAGGPHGRRRNCRTCRREAAQRWQAKQRAARVA